MPIVQNILFHDKTPKDVIDLWLWAMKKETQGEVRPRLRVWMDDGSTITGKLGATRPPGTATVYQPGVYVGTANSTGFIPVQTELINRIEHNNKQNGGVLYDGIPFETVLATSLSLQQLETELKAKEDACSPSE